MTALRTDMMQIELFADGDTPYLFDASESLNDSITIKRVRSSDDASMVARLVNYARHHDGRILLTPLNAEANPCGDPISYIGEMKVSTKSDANFSDVALLVVQIENAKVGA